MRPGRALMAVSLVFFQTFFYPRFIDPMDNSIIEAINFCGMVNQSRRILLLSS